MKLIIRERMILLPVIVLGEKGENVGTINKKGEELKVALVRKIHRDHPDCKIKIRDSVPALNVHPLTKCYLFGIECPPNIKRVIKEITRETAKKLGIKGGKDGKRRKKESLTLDDSSGG